jgi:hypothetical protein
MYTTEHQPEMVPCSALRAPPWIPPPCEGRLGTRAAQNTKSIDPDRHLHQMLEERGRGAEWNGSEQNSESLLLFLFHRMEFRVVFFSAEGFGSECREFASICIPRNGIPCCFLFHGRIRKRIPRGCFYFCSTERNLFRWRHFALVSIKLSSP